MIFVYIVLAHTKSNTFPDIARQLGLASLILSIVGISLGLVVLVVSVANAKADEDGINDWYCGGRKGSRCSPWRRLGWFGYDGEDHDDDDDD